MTLNEQIRRRVNPNKAGAAVVEIQLRSAAGPAHVRVSSTFGIGEGQIHLGLFRLSPDAARKVAADLLAAADEIDEVENHDPERAERISETCANCGGSHFTDGCPNS